MRSHPLASHLALRHLAFNLLVVVIQTARGLAIEPTQTPPVLSVTFLAGEASRITMRGSDQDPFFANLYPREIGAMTGRMVSGGELEEQRLKARDFFMSAVLEFREDERAAIQSQLSKLDVRCGDRFPRLVRHPWRFLKIRNELCGGFSFTRGSTIVMSQRTVDRFVTATNSPALENQMQGLLLHEQTHVLQREQPELFLSLYEQIFGYHRASVTVHPWVDERQVTNPDGVDDNWVFEFAGGGESTRDEPPRAYWLGTLLIGEKTLHTMGRDFTDVAVELVRPVATDKDRSWTMRVDASGTPIHTPLDQLPELRNQFPTTNGIEHPNELAAYLLSQFAMEGPSPDSAGDSALSHTSSSKFSPASLQAATMLREAQSWFASELLIDTVITEELP